ncbi:MAG: 16S rRNA (cytosine(967)-C(5))-methyltransferase RsmB [Candidatus Lindowbacteria bacterium]|nr:16S rRNA (cytosine(967)-C(5))-methyltransferase RsmB [Candidatus Lindowbacteria bacterium]
MASKVDPVREQALKILRRTEATLSFPKLLLEYPVEETPSSRRDRAFTYQLAIGTLRHRGAIDWALQKICHTPMDEMTIWIRNILRMGMYQVLFLDRVPKSAVVNESVELAKKYGHMGTAGLVNAVLRNADKGTILREINGLGEEQVCDISAKYSHPAWLVELLLKDWGRETTIEILKRNNTIPPLTARVNTLRAARGQVLQELEREGVRATPLKHVDEGVELISVSAPVALRAHRQGLLYLQDASSMLAAHCLGAKPGEKVLDVCAGPGGKTTHIAALMNNEGAVYALDIHDHRITLIERNARKLGVTIIKARREDATAPLAPRYGGMDRVMVDVPCSGLGVIRRRVDLKWRLRFEQIEGLARLQSEILESAAECVRPGGILVYCTCTITRRENADVIESFLRRHPEFNISAEFPAQLEKYVRYVRDDAYVQMLPGDGNMDGFFIARLKRL